MAYMRFKKLNLNNLFTKYSNGGASHSCCGCGSCNNKVDGGCSSETPRTRSNLRTDLGADFNTGSYKEVRQVTNAPRCTSGDMRDKGNEPIVFDIRREAFMTPDYRTALWTGGNLQLTVMTIPVGEDTGVEIHEGVDQLVGVVSGAGEVSFGNRENYFAPSIPLDAHSVILVPSGTYHIIKNVGRTPLKLYSVYAPRVHKFGTVDKTNDE